MVTTQSEYIPGMCNINKAEIAYRRKAAIGGFVVAGILLIGLLLVDVPGWVRALVVFVPLYVGVIGIFQVRNKFCVSYGASGRQNASEGSESAHDVTDQTARSADKAKARRMNLQALVITLATCAVIALIPVL